MEPVLITCFAATRAIASSRGGIRQIPITFSATSESRWHPGSATLILPRLGFLRLADQLLNPLAPLPPDPLVMRGPMPLPGRRAPLAGCVPDCHLALLWFIHRSPPGDYL